jgi:hypothetical protein
MLPQHLAVLPREPKDQSVDWPMRGFRPKPMHEIRVLYRSVSLAEVSDRAEPIGPSVPATHNPV